MSDSSTPFALITAKTDADRARDIREKLQSALEPVCLVMDEANSAGFMVNFAIGKDWRGLSVIGSLDILKKFV